MVKLVLLHKADSIYEDEPDTVYDFPSSYLGALQEALGDWVIYYEPVKAPGHGAISRWRGFCASFPNRGRRDASWP